MVKTNRVAGALAVATLAALAASGAAGCRTMSTLDGGDVLYHWLFDDDPSVLVTRDAYHEWAPVPDQWYSRDLFIDRLTVLLSALEIRVDVIGRRIEVRLDAADASFSPHRRGMVDFVDTFGPYSKSSGEPLFSASFEDLALAAALVCDPDPAADGADDDGTDEAPATPNRRTNDCPFANALWAGTHPPTDVPCPMLGNCDVIGLVDDALADVTDWMSSLSFRITSMVPRWARGARGGPEEETRPILNIRYHADVSWEFSPALGAVADLNAVLDEFGIDILEYGFSEFEGSVMLALGAGDGLCPTWGAADPDHGPGVRWTGFAPGVEIPGVTGDAEWATRNLELRRYTSYLSSLDEWTTTSDFHVGLGAEGRGAAQTFLGLLETARLEGDLRMAEAAVQAGLDELTQRMGEFVERYLTFLLPAGSAPLSSGMVWIAVNAIPNPADESEPGMAKAVLMRLLEGMAGGSRYFWNTMTAPVEELEARLDGASFEYTGTGGRFDSPGTTIYRATFQAESDSDCDGIPDHEDGCPTWGSDRGAPDTDGDGLADFCDMCIHLPRRDSGLPRESTEYAFNPGRLAYDTDRDGVSDRCDYCPNMPARFDPDPEWAADPMTSPIEHENAWVDLDWGADPGSPGPPPDYVAVGFWPDDYDADGIGDRCDNCPTQPNRDQWDCNASWERENGWLSEPPSAYRVGHGDACDNDYPCVDACIAPETEPMLEIDQLAGSYEWASAPDEATAYVSVCPDMLASSAEIDTRVRRCHCEPEEVEDQPCQGALLAATSAARRRPVETCVLPRWRSRANGLRRATVGALGNVERRT